MTGADQKTTQAQNRPYLTAVQAAAHLGVSERTFHKLRAEEWMPLPRLLGGGRVLRWITRELDEAIRFHAPAEKGRAQPSQLARGRNSPLERAEAEYRGYAIANSAALADAGHPDHAEASRYWQVLGRHVLRLKGVHPESVAHENGDDQLLIDDVFSDEDFEEWK